MKTFYQVGIIENKIFDGSADGYAKRDCRTRILTFDALEDAVQEYDSQVKRVKSVCEYSKRHKATESIHIIVNVVENGVKVVQPYWLEIDYKDGKIGSFEATEE